MESVSWLVVTSVELLHGVSQSVSLFVTVSAAEHKHTQQRNTSEHDAPFWATGLTRCFWE
jgi:hypothetical protein